MDERARRIGADWRIESEPGEGTRVELVFPIERKPQRPERVAA
jgi:two-component system nitrate/nitrite sensor histidine kinase NarX